MGVVRQTAPHMIRVILGLLEQRAEVMVVKPILHLVAFPSHRPDQAAVAKQAQVVRDS